MKFASITVAVVFGLSLCALAQTDQAATTPNAPSATTTAATAAAPKITGTKVGALAIEQAIFTSNEGRRDIEALGKKFEPKQTELKGLADEIDSLKKQLSAQQDKLNDEAREKLVKQIETKQKSFERASQDAQEDFQNQQGEIGNKILSKMAPLIVKYSSDNGYGMILDTSQQWPRGPVIWYGPAVDITQPIVEAYNAQSGVPAPAASTGASKPAAKPAKVRGRRVEAKTFDQLPEAEQRVYHVDQHKKRKPMTVEEAALDLDKTRDYVVYRDAETGRTSVLIRRRDGHLDLVEA